MNSWAYTILRRHNFHVSKIFRKSAENSIDTNDGNNCRHQYRFILYDISWYRLYRYRFISYILYRTTENNIFQEINLKFCLILLSFILTFIKRRCSLIDTSLTDGFSIESKKRLEGRRTVVGKVLAQKRLLVLVWNLSILDSQRSFGFAINETIGQWISLLLRLRKISIA